MPTSTSNRSLRGLFLGTGHFSAIQLTGWRSVAGAEIVGIYGRRGAAASDLAAKFAIAEHGDDLAAMLRRVQPDFADICTAVEAHEEHIEACRAARVPILCQKPITPAEDEARRCVEACQAAGVPLMVNDNWRWQPWYREIKRLMTAGTLGEIRHAYHTLRTGDGIGPEAYAAQPYFRKLPRFLLLETGIHYLDTYRFLFGEPVTLSCQTRRCNPVICGEDAALVTLQFPHGPTVIWDANRAIPTERQKPPFNGTLRVEGSRGQLDVDPDGRITLSLAGARPVEHRYDIPAGYRGGSVAATLQHFVDALRTGGRFETSGLDYLRTTRLVFAAYEAAETGRTLHLSP